MKEKEGKERKGRRMVEKWQRIMEGGIDDN